MKWMKNVRISKLAIWNPRLAASCLIISIIGFMAIFAPFLSRHGPIKFHPIERYQSPSPRYWFGTDQYGRDIFSRVVYGSRSTLLIGVVSAMISIVLGGIIGLLAGYFGGNVDEAIMRLGDSLLAIPSLLFALLIVGALGGSMVNAILAIGIAFVPRGARVVRSAALSVKQERFIDAAKVRGESALYIIFRELLPNIWPTIIVEASQRVAWSIFSGASLSYLGLGAQPPSPEWGLMIRLARNEISLSPYPMLFPACMLTLLIVAFNLLGDGVDDALRAYYRKRR